MTKQRKKKQSNPPDQELSAFRALLRQHNVHPKKRLGQTFLYKSIIAEEIVRRAQITPKDVAVEIGPGLGALTFLLGETDARIYALEYDSELAVILQGLLHHQTVEVIRVDALHYDYETLYNQHKIKLKIIGNLPYYLTSPLIFKLLSLHPLIQSMLVMIQKEVADRITAQPGTKDYGTISVFSQLYSVISQQLTVTKDCFYPVPQVDSEVVLFSFRDKPLVEIQDEATFEHLVRASFAKRRKTLLNAIKGANYLNSSREKIVAALEKAEVDPTRRPETLSIADFSNICTNILNDSD
ncbi:MAG: 16S rRNA (adenine(1518)-N(6)/adenine(1519)-N(6))-dimethyltransferase RsmA [Thermodesulfobacteriota bacterium]|nr:16S rRNA (adenine(1518)-N(6)/adenine(1519)-N(6))-dimethyltransferase RsmA [Thermodesulfobacteriota bacterium]